MKVYERIALKDWHVEAANGDRQEVKRGKAYTVSPPRDDGSVLLFSRFWVLVPDEVFEPWPLPQ
jgi:hypothetical protein